MPEYEFSIDKIRGLVGKKLGVSPWFTVTQEQIDDFARLTHDIAPMHVDPDWCQKYSPYKTPISFGFLTIAMLTYLNRMVIGYGQDSEKEPAGYPINYGFDRLRLISPVPVDSNIRAHFTLLEVRDHGPGETIMKTRSEVEVEHQTRPAMVADWLTMWVSTTGKD